MNFEGTHSIYNLFPWSPLGVSLATAHPAKFATTVEHATGRELPMPPQLLHFLKGTRQVTPINNGYTSFKRYLLQYANG